ncbi:hypothetical protein C8F04DRAFT_1177216 [Mycena alexandri]|uniref:Uncharacterized protein n=1 Tax=Mycena alexandri TaxID=1745969 RepID=A0AAD6XDL2_9AGAR|nr:hypothetical protein C8F04DRAFT_1177216 [Mycena alexandri]
MTYPWTRAQTRRGERTALVGELLGTGRECVRSNSPHLLHNSRRVSIQGRAERERRNSKDERRGTQHSPPSPDSDYSSATFVAASSHWAPGRAQRGRGRARTRDPGRDARTRAAVAARGGHTSAGRGVARTAAESGRAGAGRTCMRQAGSAECRTRSAAAAARVAAVWAARAEAARHDAGRRACGHGAAVAVWGVGGGRRGRAGGDGLRLRGRAGAVVLQRTQASSDAICEVLINQLFGASTAPRPTRPSMEFTPPIAEFPAVSYPASVTGLGVTVVL